MEIPTITTERLTLRAFRPEDAPALQAILEQEDVLKYFPGDDPPTLERTERFVTRQIDQWAERGYAWWAVEDRATGALLGWNGLQFLPETEETEIGYLLHKEFWGQGLATEAGHQGIRYGFETVGLDRIIALAHPENTASRRVMEKLGLRFIEETEYFDMNVARYLLERSEYEDSIKVPS